MGDEVELTHFSVGDADSGIVVAWHQIGGYDETGFRLSCANEVKSLADVGCASNLWVEVAVSLFFADNLNVYQQSDRSPRETVYCCPRVP